MNRADDHSPSQVSPLLAEIDGDASPVMAEVDVLQAVPALEYGRDQRRAYTPRRFSKHAIVALVLVVFTAGSWIIGRTARGTVQDALYLRQARTHVDDASTVVLDTDPIRAAGLIDAGSHRPLSGDGYQTVSDNDATQLIAARPDPDAFGVFREVLSDETIEQFDRNIDRYGALVFLHELTTASGLQRIVAIRYLPRALAGPATSESGLVAQVFESRGFARKPRHVATSVAPLLLPADEPKLNEARRRLLQRQCEVQPGLTTDVLRNTFMPLGPEPSMRWYAGQPDLANSAHFTIDFEIDGLRRTVDGYLTEDGGTVEMFVRPESIEPGGDFLDVSDPLDNLR